MKKSENIKISFNANLFVHTTTQIVAHYYEEYVEINEGFQNLTEDEYTKMMFAKIDNAKTKKEKDKLSKEYNDNMKKYYPFENSYTTLSYRNNINNLNGYILFKEETIKQQYDLPLLEFISYNFHNLNEYYVFFINNFNYFINKLSKEDLNKFEFNTLYKIKDITDIAIKYYEKEIDNLLKYQKLFKNCIDFCYQIENIGLNNITLQQRFFLYNQIFNNPFKELSNNFKIVNLLEYTYDNIPYSNTLATPNNILMLSSIIHAMDPEGTKLSNTFNFVTNNIFTAFYITLFNLIGMDNLYVKICGNCNRYFITPKLNIVYCDKPWDGNLTCKDVGSQLSQKKKETEEFVYGKYRKIYARKAMTIKRNPDIQHYKDEYETWKKEAKQFMDDIRNGKKNYEEFEKWLDPK